MAFIRQISAFPPVANQLETINDYLILNDFSTATELLESMFERFMRQQTLFNKNNAANCMSILITLRSKFPTYSQSYFLPAMFFQLQGDASSALKMYQYVRENFKDSWKAFLYEAKLLQSEKYYQESQRLLEEGLNNFSKFDHGDEREKNWKNTVACWKEVSTQLSFQKKEERRAMQLTGVLPRVEEDKTNETDQKHVSRLTSEWNQNTFSPIKTSSNLFTGRSDSSINSYRSVNQHSSHHKKSYSY